MRARLLIAAALAGTALLPAAAHAETTGYTLTSDACTAEIAGICVGGGPILAPKPYARCTTNVQYVVGGSYATVTMTIHVVDPGAQYTWITCAARRGSTVVLSASAYASGSTAYGYANALVPVAMAPDNQVCSAGSNLHSIYC